VGKYLDILQREAPPVMQSVHDGEKAQKPVCRCDQSDPSDISPPSVASVASVAPTKAFSRAFDALKAMCPAHIPPETWQQAIEDSRAFLAQWGEQARALGWTSRDLFSLHQPPEKPAPNYRRLSRYDETGLLWLLNGRSVVALTDNTASIRTKTGGILTYRRSNKPALGPLGDSLEDLR